MFNIPRRSPLRWFCAAVCSVINWGDVVLEARSHWDEYPVRRSEKDMIQTDNVKCYNTAKRQL